MRNRFHGVFSLLLIGAAIVIGLLAILNDSLTAGLIYAGVTALSLAVILYAYCAKCEINKTACRHVIPGKIAAMMPKRESGPYSLLDYVGVAIPLILILGWPQRWMADNKVLLVSFWTLVILGLVEILLFVCRGCGNRKCPMCVFRNG